MCGYLAESPRSSQVFGEDQNISSPPYLAQSAEFGGGWAEELCESLSEELCESLSEDENILTKESTPTSPLTSIINLQLASGAWKMSAEMAGVMAKSTAEIKNACPVRCDGEMETIWATVIVLMYLQIRQSNFRDEWELIAGKAQTWLTKQNLPEGCSIQVLREKAMAFLS
jgi:hypothetical protein